MTSSAPPGSGDERSFGRFISRLVTTLAAIVVIVFIWYTIDMLLVIFIGLIFAVFLGILSELVTRITRIKGQWALLIAVILLVGVIGGGSWLLAPRISQQINRLAVKLPLAVHQLRDLLHQHQWGRWILAHLPSFNDFFSGGGGVAQHLSGAVSITTDVIISAVVIFFVGLYFAAEPRIYLEGALHLVPKARRPRYRQVLLKTAHTLKWWLIGRMIAMTFVGVFVAAALWLLRVQLPVTLGIIAGLLTFIPNFGAIIAAIPAALIGLLESPMTAVWVIVLKTLVQCIEAYIVTPLVQKRTIHMPPVLIITAQLILGLLAGVAGLVTATPVMAVVIVLTQTLYVEDVLGDYRVKELSDR